MKKRLISLVLSLSLMLSLGGMAAYAEPLSVSDNDIQVSERASFSLRGAQAPASMKAFLDRFDIEVEDDSLIQYYPTQNNAASATRSNTSGGELENNLVYTVTTADGSDVQQDSLFAIAPQDADLPNEQMASPARISTELTFDVSAHVFVRVVSIYSLMKVGVTLCAKPEGVQVRYYKQDCTDCTVNKISARFTSYGALWEYPSGKLLQADPISHNIDVGKISPLPLTVYSSATGSIASNRCIDILHMVAKYEITISGNYYSGSNWIDFHLVAQALGIIN